MMRKIKRALISISDKKDLKKILKILANYIVKITIVEWWSTYQLNELLQNKFKNFKNIEYLDILADTYFLHSYEDFDTFYSKSEL